MKEIKIGDKLTLEQYTNDDGTIKTQKATVIDFDDKYVWAELENNKSVMIIDRKKISKHIINHTLFIFAPRDSYHWDSHYRLTH